jgi:hypothetical protein
MNVEKAEAQLALAKAEADYLTAKDAYQADPGSKPKFVKARAVLVGARDNWRTNYRTSPAGPGDASAAPGSVALSIEVN